MIIDIISLTGEKAYFTDANGKPNLAQPAGTVAVTPIMGKGKQLDVTGIQFYLEGKDLQPLFNLLEDDGNGNLIKRPKALFSVSVIKEVLPGLFADPFRSRIHTLAGFQDFKRGSFNNCDVFRLNNKPVIVSLGSDKCSWKSVKYVLPEEININHAYWEIPSSKETPAAAFTYSIVLNCYKADGTLLQAVQLANGLNPKQSRTAQNINLQGVRSYEFVFEADVKYDSAMIERIVTVHEDTIGRPLLEAIYLVETVETRYDFYSLQEFVAECVECNFFESLGKPFTTLSA
ncbi:MAG: hypothetical protein EOP53_28035, partial [Sphingobacteriales bacterium]